MDLCVKRSIFSLGNKSFEESHKWRAVYLKLLLVKEEEEALSDVIFTSFHSPVSYVYVALSCRYHLFVQTIFFPIYLAL